MKNTMVSRSVVLLTCVQGLLGCQAHALRRQPTPTENFTAANARECDVNTQWVDRIDGSWAILVSDSGDELSFPLGSLPMNLREGEVLRGGRRDLRCSVLLKARIRGLLGALDNGTPRDSPMDVRP